MSKLEQNKTDEERIKIRWCPLLILIIIVIVLCLAYLIAIIKYIEEWSTRGEFGDLFGGLNTLFSGLAFSALIYAIYLQHKELKLQRIELKQTRKELEGQKLQLEAQNKTMQKQNFENTFFELLRLHNELVRSIELPSKSHGEIIFTKGRNCFKYFYKRFRSHFTVFSDTSDKLDQISRTNDKLFEEHQADLGHYFRNLYNIIKFVKNSSVEDKRLYTNLIRAQLSSFELALLFYNCLGDIGREKFKPLVEEFALLKNMPDGILIDSSHKEFYDERAFGKLGATSY